MFAHVKRRVGAIALVAIMTFGSLGLVGAVVGGVPTAHVSPAPTAARVIPTVPSGPLSASTSSAAASGPSTYNAGASLAAAALAATRAAGLKPNVVFPPRPSATPEQLAAAQANGTVAPLYTGSPAPMGLAYFGLSAGPSGQPVGTILNTTRLIGTVNMNATGVQAADLFQTSPDSYGIQMNAVLTNITLFGRSGYSFWTQNVVEFLPASHLMLLVTNVWNFSALGATMTPNIISAHGHFGTNFYAELGYYYSELVWPAPVSYPFDLTLFMNSTVTNGSNAVNFTVQLTSAAYPGEDFTAPYDYVVFNSTVNGHPLITAPSNYTANGLAYNPQGLTNDFELIFGGPGGGSQATLFAADATLGLGYWNGHTFVSVPSAFSYGGETGETVTGANIAWSNDLSKEPHQGLGTYGTMTTGPSILTGLWNASGPEGSYPVQLNVAPANAFNIIAPSTGWSPEFTISEPALAPELSTNVVYLMPGSYSLETELADYAPVTTELTVSGPMTVAVALTPNSGFGVYTPLWAFSNAEVAAISSSGSGTASSPYVVDNNQPGAIGPAFGLYNDYGFPVYPGVFFYGTTATTEFDGPPSLEAATNTFAFPGQFLPATNDLQYWFWNVENVAVVNAVNISGWFDATTFYPTSFDTFNMIFYEGGNNLVANDTFDTQGQALLIFSGGGIFAPPLNIGGQNDTVWGNSFLQTSAPPPGGACATVHARPCDLLPFFLGLGLELAGSNNTVYDNAFVTPTTAWVLPLNLYSGSPEFFAVTFNIPRQAANVVHYAPGFPFVPLVGSIIGTTYQGGNYWWDYGWGINPFNGADNPYGLLPYEERAHTLLVDVYGPAYYYATYIYPGGDYVPLIPVTLYPVVVSSVGLPTGALWGVTVSEGTTTFDAAPTNLSSYTIYLPNGTYHYSAIRPAGWVTVGKSSGTLRISGTSSTLQLTFLLKGGYRLLTFVEKGLPKGTAWSVTVNATSPSNYLLNATETTTLTALRFAAIHGLYDFVVAPVAGYTVTPSSGSVILRTGSATVVHLVFTKLTSSVTFSEVGLPTGTGWSVSIGGRTVHSTATSIVVPLNAATYAYAIHLPRGYVASPSTGSFTVSGAPVSVPVTVAPP